MSRRFVAVVAAGCVLAGAAPVSPVQAAPVSATSTRASADLAARIAALTAPYSSPTPPGPSATLSDVRAAAEVSRQVTALLSSAGDRRGVFGVGLDVVEERAVIPFEENSSQWAQALSANLIFRYLSAVHAEFSGGEVPQHWARYFDSGATMAGDNAHLSVDLALAVADSGAGPDNYGEYLRIVGAIADTAGLIVERTQSTYGDDLVPLWEAAAIPVGHEGREEVVRFGDQAFSSISFANGLGLERVESRAVSEAAVQSPWRSGDAVIVGNLES
ncbi:hypothetical protein [Corynebacterium lactis]|uniref:hypothetical protein n=1 Tax=Corynebacterium lactis TaxID=1231000 RepID=UPI0012E21A59|nr:hypothetical protein [Corynebacterium lactis]